MELRQLEYLVEVSAEASFTKAAAKLHVAQPGVSAQIRQLERELGQPLLDRSGRTVRPTEVGAAVLPYARAALQAVAGVRLAVDELTGLLHGHVVLADFHRHHPAVEMTLKEDNSDRLLDSLADGQLDMAVVGMSGNARPGIATHVAADEPLVAAVSHTHPLANRTTITLKALHGLPLLSLPRGTGLRACIDNACVSAGFEAHIAIEASDPQVLAKFAARNFGVAILPRSIANAYPDDLHPIAITRPRLRAHLELAWRADGPASPAARALIAHTRTALSAPSSSH